MQVRIKFYFALVIVLLFGACANEREAVSTIAVGDVYIQTSVVNDELVYAPVFYAYSNIEMQTVSVNLEDQDSLVFELEAVNGKYTFANVPAIENHTSDYPQFGVYQFKVVYEDGSEFLTYDYLDSLAIQPVTLKELKYESEDNKLFIDWKKLENADAYKVWLIDLEDEIAFTTDLISSETSQITITQNSGGWYSEMKPSLEGQTVYSLVIEAFLFEPYGSAFDVQSISTFEQPDVVWGI